LDLLVPVRLFLSCVWGPTGTADHIMVHKEGDKEHSDMIWGIFEKYAVEEPGYLAVIDGARESLQIDRAFRPAMEAIEREVTCTGIQGSH
jgi:hypothetical protein